MFQPERKKPVISASLVRRENWGEGRGGGGRESVCGYWPGEREGPVLIQTVRREGGVV